MDNKVKLYGFELGRNKRLSQAELESIFSKEKLVLQTPSIVAFKLPILPPETAQALQDRLGGTIKIIEIFSQSTKKDELMKALEEKLTTHFKDHSGKIPFAVSIYNDKSHQINSKEILNFSKIFLKSLGFNCRFVNRDRQNPRSSTIFKSRTLQKGIDLNIILADGKIYSGRTVAIQNIDQYSKRDYDKPQRDAREGMLPPKLSQIMINLAGPGTKTIYDPFCGTGTVMMEAMLMGKNAIGSDLSEKMTENSQINYEWLRKNFQINTNFRVFQRDARFISKEVLPEKIDAIVTEGYLGPPLMKFPTPHEAETNFRELANLHLNWLHAIHSLLSQKTKIVMCATAYRLANGQIEHFPRFMEIAKTAGFKVLKTYTYERPDQIVVRDILVLEKA